MQSNRRNCLEAAATEPLLVSGQSEGASDVAIVPEDGKFFGKDINMTKNVVFCADGTWNGPGKDLDDDPVPVQPSNVLKMYLWLSGMDTVANDPTQFDGEAERTEVDAAGNQLQIAKYLEGVGYDNNWLVKLLGGVFGAGLITRIVRGYTFISRNYVRGDNIFIVGFSRGAYTARALAGMIIDQGLLDACKLNLNDKQNAYRAGCAMWTKHQKNRASQGKVGLLDRIEETIYDLPGFFSDPPHPTVLVSGIPIQTVAVWDTVGAMGIPQYDDEDRRLDAFRFADLDLSARVRNGFHAISLDEQRMDFTPTLWNPRVNIVQMLFPGAHADVGGGYPIGDASGLSDGALVWMQKQLANLPDGDAVRFDVPPRQVNPNACGVAHQPWIHAPYSEIPSSHAGPRSFPRGIGLSTDASVNARTRCGNVVPDPSKPVEPYAPDNIPQP